MVLRRRAVPRAGTLRGVALGSALALSGTCCSPAEAPAGPATDRTCVIAQLTTTVTLDPHMHDQELSRSVHSHFFNALVGFNPEMEVEPQLAVSWNNPTDTLWRFHLRKGVFFHDGRPFGAADVVTSLKRAVELPGSKVRYYLQAMEGVRAVDESTVEVTTRTPSAVFLNKLVFIDIVPRDTGHKPIERPIGTGPYRFVSGSVDGTIEGERNERFWGEKPEFSRVRIVGIPNDRERLEAVLSKRADIAGRLSPEDWEWGRAQTGLRMVSREGLGVVMLSFSFAPGSPFTDRRLRRAFRFALDRTALAGHRRSETLAIPMEQIVPPGVFGYARDMPTEPIDVPAARALVEEARGSKGLETSLLIAEADQSLAREIAAQAAAVGIHIRIVALPSVAFYQRQDLGQDPLCLFRWAAATGDASDILDAVIHTRRDGYGGSNFFHYSNPKLDREIEALNRTLNASERSERIANAMSLLREDVPVLPLFVPHALYAVRPEVDWMPRRDRKIRAFDLRLRATGGAS